MNNLHHNHTQVTPMIQVTVTHKEANLAKIQKMKIKKKKDQ